MFIPCAVIVANRRLSERDVTINNSLRKLREKVFINLISIDVNHTFYHQQILSIYLDVLYCDKLH